MGTTYLGCTSRAESFGLLLLFTLIFTTYSFVRRRVPNDSDLILGHDQLIIFYSSIREYFIFPIKFTSFSN